MDISNKKELFFDAIYPFNISVCYNESEGGGTSPHHIHNECEIYINIDGDVSFMVENRIYPIKKGSIIIARPWEYHHCICHSKKTHKHFWILLSSNGNEKFLSSFFNRPNGMNNLIELSDEKTKILTDICMDMIKKDLNAAEKYIAFFRIVSLLGSGNASNESETLPEDISDAIEYIDKNINKPLTVKDVASYIHTSVNTLERHFNSSLQISPSKYIKRKKLILASVLLKKQIPLSDVCEQCGFTDYNGFISSFRKEFGITPNRYKNHNVPIVR